MYARTEDRNIEYLDGHKIEILYGDAAIEYAKQNEIDSECDNGFVDVKRYLDTDDSSDKVITMLLFRSPSHPLFKITKEHELTHCRQLIQGRIYKKMPPEEIYKLEEEAYKESNKYFKDLSVFYKIKTYVDQWEGKKRYKKKYIIDKEQPF